MIKLIICIKSFELRVGSDGRQGYLDDATGAYYTYQ